MARTYSPDLRVRVLDAVDAGLSRRAAALRYRVGFSTVIRRAAHARMTAETQARPQGRPPGSKLDENEAFLLALSEEKDDITLAEMQELLRTGRSVSVGLGTLWRFFARRAVTWKKIGARYRAGPPRRGRSARGVVCRAARPRS